MSKEYNAKEIAPPKDREVLVQIITNYGHCDLNWYNAKFDKGTQDDLKVYDSESKLVGEVWFWKELTGN